MRGRPRSQASRSSPSASRVATAISSIAAKRGWSLGDWLANSRSDSGPKSISSVLPTTPCQPRSRMKCFLAPSRCGAKKHFIRIADHTLPAEIANAIHNLHGTCSGVGQIAAVEDQVGRGLPQIRQDCLERGKVAVDVGDDGDAHHSSPGYLTSSNSPFARMSREDAPTNTVNRPGSATQS